MTRSHSQGRDGAITRWHAHAYRVGDRLLLHAVARTRAGIGISVPPVHRFAVDAERASIGAALRGLLTVPPSIVPAEDWRGQAELRREFLKAAGFRSWRSLEADAVSCGIVRAGGVITLTPMRNGGIHGDRKGFQPFAGPPLDTAETATDTELGAALIEALNRSR